MSNKRIEKAVELVKQGRIVSLESPSPDDPDTKQYIVYSAPTREYLVSCSKRSNWTCSCDEYKHYENVCKHIISVIMWLGVNYGSITV